MIFCAREREMKNKGKAREKAFSKFYLPESPAAFNDSKIGLDLEFNCYLKIRATTEEKRKAHSQKKKKKVIWTS